MKGRLVVLAITALAASPSTAPAVALCATDVDLPGQGPACAFADGLFGVPLPDGRTLVTHGPDPPLPRLAPQAAVRGAYVCVDATENHAHLVIARPANRPPALSVKEWLVRNEFLDAASQVVASAAERGGVVRVKTLCDAHGLPVVSRATLATPQQSASFSTIANDLWALGFSSPRADYWVLYEGSVGCDCAGQGSFSSDDRPGAENRNNVGPDYAITYGDAANAFVMLHEAGHNMGAVQTSAPHSTGAAHCTDGLDVMCYDDGGPRAGAYTAWACPGAHAWDCGHDDYFDPTPAPASYLATRWNLASPSNLAVRAGP